MTRAHVLLACSTLFSCATAGSPPATAPEGQGFSDPVKAAAASIRPEAIASHIRFLADDLLAGREPGTPGFEIAARYAASELQSLGLRPAGENGTYFQTVPMVGGKLRTGTLEFEGGPGKQVPMVPAKNVVILPTLDSGHVDVSGEVVFAGYGLQVPEYRY
ncbi:MAG TPA: peptidase M28, partial [Myxococcaceae bacterium]|nr:peptidase M28 [Myxococcaceae bacterium]